MDTQKTFNKPRAFVYLCHSVQNREELGVAFNSLNSDIKVVRWGELPNSVRQIHCGVSDDLEDVRCKKLQTHGIVIVKSTWLQACIQAKKVVSLPNSHDPSAAAILITDEKNMCSRGNKNWSKAEDDAVRDIYELRIRGSVKQMEKLENMLVARTRTLPDIHQRECFLFGAPEWTEEEDALIGELHTSKLENNVFKVEMCTRALLTLPTKRAFPDLQGRERALFFIPN